MNFLTINVNINGLVNDPLYHTSVLAFGFGTEIVADNN